MSVAPRCCISAYYVTLICICILKYKVQRRNQNLGQFYFEITSCLNSIKNDSGPQSWNAQERVCTEHRGHVIRVEIMISFRQPSIKGVFTHVFRITSTSIVSGKISGRRREINLRNIIGNVGKTRTHRVLFGFLITYRDANSSHGHA